MQPFYPCGTLSKRERKRKKSLRGALGYSINANMRSERATTSPLTPLHERGEYGQRIIKVAPKSFPSGEGFRMGLLSWAFSLF